jgi:heat shock protein HtpX
MFRRIVLFAITNLLVVLTLTFLFKIFGIGQYTSAIGMDYGGLFIFCLFWGMGGAFISLGLSRIMAKFAMGVKVIDPRSPGAYGEIVEMVHELAQRAKLPAMPQVGVYESPEINAFATGPTKSRALVAVSTGLLRRMNRDEIEGVLGHEIAHVANGDMVTMTLLQGVINAFVMFLARVIAFAISQRSRNEDGPSFGGNWLVVMLLEMILSPLGFLVVAWFSRYREFRADAGGAAYAGKGKMIGALQALSLNFDRQDNHDPRSEKLATMKISGKKSGFMALMSTHPPLEDRIAALKAARSV